MKFKSVVELGGKTATGIEVPTDVVEALGQGKRPAVTVTIKKYTYRSTIASMGGRFMLPLSAEHREAAGVAAGDAIDVTVELDTAPRVVEVPADLQKALGKNAAAKNAFAALSYSHQRRWVLHVEGTKNQETRARRIAKAVEDIAAGK